MKVQIELEFDEEELGLAWMNIFNLELLLYSKEATRKDLLQILSYKEIKKKEQKSDMNDWDNPPKQEVKLKSLDKKRIDGI